ncbi:zinc ABC transporter substrate-binding protein [Shimia sp. R10_1]|uniref:zinc ABC transporter substrate-binding protein n=1 Tax=Shimia sp. R10_1 TaxID=2821095 RepID=UPI001FFE22EE|nr:zinc ABC transporter substrate-binding protein [Shimia sp. R10_1]
MRFIPMVFAATLLAAPLRAEAPRVVTDILPVQALVAKVMEGVGTPEQLLPANQSPHSYALRPSEARALQNADLVVWIGTELSPAMDEAIDSLVSEGEAFSLLHLNGTRELEFREEGAFLEISLSEDGDHEGHGHDAHGHDDHGHDDHDDHADEHDHDDHADHKDDDHAGHDDHDHGEEKHADHDAHDAHEGHDDHDDHAEAGHDDEHHHDHDGVDPHAWLDPQNAQFWMGAIAEKLATLDPENAEAYRANAVAGQAELEALSTEIAAELAPLKGHGFVVFHDAYQYFETRFGLSASGAILSGDGAAPSAARLDAVRDVLHEKGVTCVFTEPQFNAKVVKAISSGLDLHSEELDPLGATLETADYPALIRNMAEQFEHCLGGHDH